MLNIAIDGPSGAGKSTVARILAKRLNITYLDTGAMYRAVGLKCLRLGLRPDNKEDVLSFLFDTDIEVIYSDGTQKVYVDGEDVTSLIREHRISKSASDISKHSEVRELLVKMQQDIASKQDIVLDGRDITSKVLPNSKNKFFLTASSECRAKRRYNELILKGEQVDYDRILEDIIQRDYNDSHRANSPLVQTEDSYYIDSSNMTVEQVVDLIISKVVR